MVDEKEAAKLAFNVSQFQSNPLTEQVTVVLTADKHSIALYAPALDGKRSSKDQIKASTLAFLDQAKAAIEAL